MNGEQHPARMMRRHVMQHARTQHENALRVQIVGLPAGFVLRFDRQRAVENVNGDEAIGFMIGQLGRRFQTRREPSSSLRGERSSFGDVRSLPRALR